MVPGWVFVLTVSLWVALSEGFYPAALGLSGRGELGVAPWRSGQGCEMAATDVVGAVVGCCSWRQHLASVAAFGFWRVTIHPRNRPRDQVER